MKFETERLIPDRPECKPMLQTHLARYRLAAPFIQDAVVLDAGCGCGYGTHYLTTNGTRQAIGIDISSEAIEYARQHYVAPHLDYKVMDVTSLDFPDATFDVVVCLEIFEHVPDHKKLLAEAWRVLKPDGCIVISTPNGEIFSPDGKPINPWHVREFSRDEFEDVLAPLFQNLQFWAQTVKTPGTLQATLFHLRMQRHITTHTSLLSRFFEIVYGGILQATMRLSHLTLGRMTGNPNVIVRADELSGERAWYFIATGRKKVGLRHTTLNHTRPC
jgi:2-polyprenyl-3-methyl-5-hydroxy-6-metoxy-1,4-benzoquinol methylase